jgi:hypothetical protein
LLQEFSASEQLLCEGLLEFLEPSTWLVIANGDLLRAAMKLVLDCIFDVLNMRIMACEGAGGFHTYLDSIDDLG